MLLYLLVVSFLLTPFNNQAQFLIWTSTIITNWGGDLPASIEEF